MSARSGSTAAVRSRRAFLGAALGTPLALAATAAQPPATIPPSPPRDWNGGDPLRYPDPDVVVLDSAVPALRDRQHADPPPAHRHALGRGAGMERRRPLPGVERHPQQRPVALGRGRRPGQRVPQSVGPQQRQHLRPAGPPAVLRALRAPRRPLRARRVDHRHRRALPGQAAQLAQRRRRALRRQHLVHRPDLRHPRQLRRLQGRLGDQAGRLPRRSRHRGGRAGHRRGHRPQRAVLLARLQPPLRRRHRQRPRHPRARRRRRDGAQPAAPRGAVGAGLARCRLGRRWHALRRRREHLGGSAAGRAGDRTRRRRHRDDPPAGELCQRRLRRDQAQSAVHDREPVALLGLRGHAGRRLLPRGTRRAALQSCRLRCSINAPLRPRPRPWAAASAAPAAAAPGTSPRAAGRCRRTTPSSPAA